VGLASHLQDEREPVPGRNVLGLGEVEREGQATRTGRPACEVVDEGAERAVLWHAARDLAVDQRRADDAAARHAAYGRGEKRERHLTAQVERGRERVRAPSVD